MLAALGNLVSFYAEGGPADAGALYAEDSTANVEIPNGAEAGWLFTAPAATTITGLTYYRSLHAYNQQNDVVGLCGQPKAPRSNSASLQRRLA